MKNNLIIRASAGTGKTFSLATRFIRLMLFDGVSPEKIVALTFSRAAAQEIYTKLLERLWCAAMSDEGAARERRILLDRLPAADLAAIGARNLDWSRGAFASVLRRVVDTQHYNAIATLDSFILRIVRSFPLEMGFQHAVDVLDTYGEQSAVSKAREKLLSDRGAGDVFAEAFKTAQKGDFVRTCSKALGDVLRGWREFILVHPEAKGWTADAMRRALGIDAGAARPDLGAVPVSGKESDVRDKFVALVQGFTGDENIFDDNLLGRMMRFLVEHPEAEDYVYQTNGSNEKRIACGAAGSAAVRAAVRWMVERQISRQLDVVAAKLRLCALVEGEYDAATRRQGLLTFSDFTDCQATNEDSDRGLMLQNLQFRFDSKFDHWALDEFQDTSELQWKCLKRLVREAAGGGDRSVMAVGDLKQSIYTWRGGNDAPFKEMMESWGEFGGELGEIVKSDVSFRYERHTADFVNAVFGEANVRGSGLAGADCADAADRWLAADCWMEHHPDTDAEGREKDGDYVELVGVVPAGETDGAAPTDEDDGAAGGTAPMKRLAPRFCEMVRDFWLEHERAGSTDTVGILVRNNKDGAFLAECLREMEDAELPVVWEGAEGVLDAPVVRAVLELVKLAAHPEDRFAWTTVNSLFPVREAVFPELETPAGVSCAMARMLSHLGLARALREIVSALTKPEHGLDPRSTERLEALVREGVNFEQRRDAAADVGKFADYLAAAAGREIAASPHVIRILSIHRSKGLTLDHVFVPILEYGNKVGSVVKPRAGTVLAGPGWVVGALPEFVALAHPATRTAWREAANARLLEQLRMYYVALTRARRSTHVVMLQDDHGDCVQFRDFLRRPFKSFEAYANAYGVVLYEAGRMPAFRRKPEAVAARTPWEHDAGRPPVERRSPSAEGGRSGHGGAVTGSVLFGAGFGAAAAQGTADHAAYAGIGWIDPTAAMSGLEERIWNSPWREAFEPRDGVRTLWRERAYEFVCGDIWESGQFDRVVFQEKDGVRGAVVYDFKTNALRDGESPDEFGRRMRETYAGQMQAYRRALARLTGIPPANIALKLLLAKTMACVDAD